MNAEWADEHPGSVVTAGVERSWRTLILTVFYACSRWIITKKMRLLGAKVGRDAENRVGLMSDLPSHV